MVYMHVLYFYLFRQWKEGATKSDTNCLQHGNESHSSLTTLAHFHLGGFGWMFVPYPLPFPCHDGPFCNHVLHG